MTEHSIPLATKVVVGSCVFALQTLGVDGGVLVYSAVGALFGGGGVVSRNPVRAILDFLATVLLCALFGTLLAQLLIAKGWLDDSPMGRNACAALLALVFPIAINAVVARLPGPVGSVVDAAFAAVTKRLDRWSGK